MRHNLYKISILLLAGLMLVSCAKEDKLAADGALSEFAAAEEGNTKAFVSALSGRKFNVNSVRAGVVNVKFNDELVEIIERHKADVAVLSVQTKSADSPFSRVALTKMERLFPYAGKFEARTRAEGLHKWYKLYLDEDFSLAQAEVLLHDAEGVEHVEFSPMLKANFGFATLAIPVGIQTRADETAYVFDDPLLPSQWHYINDGSKSGMVKGSDINVASVWEDYLPGNPEVIVAITDGGIDAGHVDLVDNLWKDPQTGSIGRNFVDNNSVITAHDHGTHVAGTVAAVNNNGIGVSGVAGGDKARGIPGVKLMSCQIFKYNPNTGKDKNGDSVAAIKWSADNGAVISQNSWGYDKDIDVVFESDKAAINYFNKYAGFDENGVQVGPMAGGLVIFAAGNDNVNYGSPAMYDGCVAVAAIGADYKKAYYSCYGSWVDICAPGGDAEKGYEIYSTLPNDSYGRMQGTSMACPHVSGVAALIVSNLGGPGFTADKLRELLVDSASEEVLKYNTQAIGLGLVSAANAVAGDRPTDHHISVDGSSSVIMRAGQTREFTFSIKNPTGHNLSYTLTPEIEGVSVKKNPTKPGKSLIVTVDGPKVVGQSWQEDKVLDFRLSVSCEKEPGEVHFVDFTVTINANKVPYMLKELEGLVVDKLGKATKLALNDYFFDPDGDPLTYTVEESKLGKFEIVGNEVKFTAKEFGAEEIEVTAKDIFGAPVSATFTLLVRDGESRSVDIYPNPVVDYLYVRGSSKEEFSIKIYNTSGACVFEDTAKSEPFEPAKFDLIKLPGGTYTVIVTEKNNKFEVTQKIAKI